MAAQVTILKRLRLSRWMITGIDAAPAAMAAVVIHVPNMAKSDATMRHPSGRKNMQRLV